MTTPTSPPTRDFDPLVLASITADCLLCRPDELVEAVEFIVGRTIDGDDYIALEPQISAEIVRQFPRMPRERHRDGWGSLARAVRTEFGQTITVTGGLK